MIPDVEAFHPEFEVLALRYVEDLVDPHIPVV